jgi:hypothetical protein
MPRRNFSRQQTTVALAGGGWVPILGPNPGRVGLIIFPAAGGAIHADFDGDTAVGQGLIIPTNGVALTLDYGLMGEGIKGAIRFDSSAAAVLNLVEIINLDKN